MLDEAGATSEPSLTRARLLTRLVIGTASLGRERLLTALEKWDAEVGESGGERAALPPPSAMHFLVGALVLAPGAVARRIAHATRWYEETVGADVQRLGRAISMLPMLTPLIHRCERLRAQSEEAARRWGAVGAEEEIRGRALAGRAVDEFLEFWLRKAAESPEVQELIKEQSSGLSQLAVDRVREGSERADDVLESFVDRVFRRPLARRARTPLPPSG